MQEQVRSPPDIGANLRNVRKLQGLSLDALAKLSGVSRAMLGQIETGKSVPTVTLIWKIATALSLPAAALIDTPDEATCAVVRRTDVHRTSSSDGRYILGPLFGTAAAQPFEFYDVQIAPNHIEHIAALPPGTRATLVVASGSITVAVGGGPHQQLGQGDAILFHADTAHFLSNPKDEAASGYLVLATRRNTHSR